MKNISEKKRVNILHIDDERLFLELAETYLKEVSKDSTYSYNVLPESDPIQALKTIKDDYENKHEIDIILCDYRFESNIDGLEILETIRNEYNIDTPFIILTGKGREEVAIEALNQGADFYVQKTFETETLFTEIKHFITTCIERQDAKKRLIESEEKYRRIFEAIPDIFFLVDKNATIIDYKAKKISDRVSIFENIIDKQIHDFFPKELASEMENIIKQTLGTKIPQIFRYEYEECYYEARFLFFEENQIAIFIRDITSQKMSELKLEESEKFYRTIVDNSPIGIFTVNDNYKFIYTNSKMTDILDYSTNELLGMDFREVLSPESLEKVVNAYLKRQRGEEAPSEYDIYVISAQGEKKHLNLTARAIKDKQGNIQTIGQVLPVKGTITKKNYK